MPRFGDVLEELRKSRDLSQAKLAEQLGWKQSKVSYLEALEEVPKEDDLRVVCEFFGLPPSYFYDRRRDRKPTALEYLRSLRNSKPEESPKAAIAFYSRIDRLSKEEQDEAVKITEKHLRSKREQGTEG